METSIVRPSPPSLPPFSLMTEALGPGTSLMAQWFNVLRFHCRGGMGSIPGWGTNIPQAPQCGQRRKKEKH